MDAGALYIVVRCYDSKHARACGQPTPAGRRPSMHDNATTDRQLNDRRSAFVFGTI